MTFVQDNQSMSVKGVLRGLHYQINHPQGKLVRVIWGQVFDVAVDLRKTPQPLVLGTGKYSLLKIRSNSIFLRALPTVFYVLSDTAEFVYKCTDFYHPGDEGGLRWNDPAIE